MQQTDLYPKMDWWIERSELPEHQLLYDRVVDYIDIGESDVFLDVGMGTGDVLLLLFQKTTGAKLYGSDISEGMIELCKARLEQQGIEVVVREASSMLPQDYTEENKLRDRVCLLFDDITDTEIQGSFTYITTVLRQLTTNPHNLQRMRNFSPFSFQITPENLLDFAHVVCFYGALQNIRGRLTPNGRYLDVDYVLEGGLDEDVTGIRLFAEGFDLAREPQFYNSPEVYADTDEVVDNRIGRGYRFLEMRKINKL